MTLALVNCPEPKKDDTTSTLLPLLLLSSSTRSTTTTDPTISITQVFHTASGTSSRALPGAAMSISGTNFSTTLSDVSVTVKGTAATVTATSSTVISFTMPDISSITENQSVEVVVKSKSSTATTNITYYPTPTISPNVTNSFNRSFNGSGATFSHWYKFTAAGETQTSSTLPATPHAISTSIFTPLWTRPQVQLPRLVRLRMLKS